MDNDFLMKLYDKAPPLDTKIDHEALISRLKELDEMHWSEHFFNSIGVQVKNEDESNRFVLEVLRDIAKRIEIARKELSSEEFIIFQKYILQNLLGIRYAHVFQQPVPSGKWIYVDGDLGYSDYKCSNCEEIQCIYDEESYKYCPNCGSKMDGMD